MENLDLRYDLYCFENEGNFYQLCLYTAVDSFSLYQGAFEEIVKSVYVL